MGFEFLTIVRNGPDSSIYRLSLSDELKEEMARSFTIPAGRWMEPEIARTPFDEAYTLDDTQIFEIKKFLMPPDLLNAARFPNEYTEFNATTQGIADLKAIVAVNADDGRITMIFKTVGKAKKIVPAKNLMLVAADAGYQKQAFPGIIIDDRVAAVFDSGALLFKSPSSVKQVLSLKDYLKAANDLEIVQFLEARFETNTEKVLAVTDTWMRKKFTALMQSNIFEERSALDIFDTAKSFSAEIPLQLSKDRSKIVLPEEKQDIRMILKFLNEEYYKGMLTGKDYQTSSRRPLGGEKTGGHPRKAELNFSR